jgi:hypothetical protein
MYSEGPIAPQKWTLQAIQKRRVNSLSWPFGAAYNDGRSVGDAVGSCGFTMQMFSRMFSTKGDEAGRVVVSLPDVARIYQLADTDANPGAPFLTGFEFPGSRPPVSILFFNRRRGLARC